MRSATRPQFRNTAASLPKPPLSMVALLGLLMLVARLLVCATVAAAVPVVAALHLAPLLFNPVTEPWAVVLCLNFPWLSGSAVSAVREGQGAPVTMCNSLPAGPAACHWSPYLSSSVAHLCSTSVI